MSYCYEFRHFACGQCGSVLVLFDLWFVVHNWVLVIALPVFIGGYYRGVGVHLIDVCRCFFVFDFCLLPLGEILVCIGIILLGFGIVG